MHSSQILVRLSASIVCVAGIANAAYTIQDTFDASNFFTEFTFFDSADPTQGFVDYAAAGIANNTGLAGYSNGAVYLGVDHTTLNPENGRNAVRVSSTKSYTHGLFVADISHSPGGICGVWPAFWTFGPNWPVSGEIDIIEGVNAQLSNQVTLHTSSGCTMSSTGSASNSFLADVDCNADNAGTGCGIETVDTSNYGAGFNANGGGVYAMDWTSSAIQVYFFPRNAIPEDITSGAPVPSSWGTPSASFSGPGCDIDTHFINHNIIFDTTFCGTWAGEVWNTSATCAPLAPTCDEYVAQTPSAFVEAFWMINSVKVYQEGSASTNYTASKRSPVPFNA